jgi:pimeloyl-ACP methyl ester carboxylesterase
MRRALAAALLAAAGLATIAANADHLEHQICPAEPTREFPAGFVAPVDRQAVVCSETANPWIDTRVGGWGGGDCPADHVSRIPVVFVHGNGVDGYYFNSSYDSTDGSHVNVRQRFLDAGYCARELWAITYSGEATPARGQAASYNTYADINADEVLAFLKAVRDFTGAPQVDVVAHSLGVTVARKAMFLHRADTDNPYELVRRFIAIAGANHGTTTCRGEEDAAALHVCEEAHPGSPWLAELNAAGESPGPTKWLTVCDCTGVADQFYMLMDAESPLLDGAEVLRLPLVGHLALASSEGAIAAYMPFAIEGSAGAAAKAIAEPAGKPAPRTRPVADPAVRPAARPLPATGVARVALSWVAALLAFATALGVIQRVVR